MPITWVKSKGRKLRVLDHSTITTPRTTQAIEVALHDLRFEFRFLTDSDGTPNVSAELESKKLVLNFINFNSGLPTAWEGEVGTFEGNALLLAVSSSAAGDFPTESRTLAYTFYTEVL